MRKFYARPEAYDESPCFNGSLAYQKSTILALRWFSNFNDWRRNDRTNPS